MLFCFTKTLAGGMPPNPRNDRRTPCPWARSAGAGSPDRARGPRGHRQPFSRHERASTRFRGSTIAPRGCRVPRPEARTGGTPTPPGVEFVRYRRSHGLEFRQTAPKTPRMAVRAVCRARQDMGSTTWMAGTQSAKDPPTGRSSSPRRSRPRFRLAVHRGPRRRGRRPRRGSARPWPPRRGSRVGAPRPSAPVAGRKRGVRGGAAPRQPPQGTHGVWLHGVSGATRAGQPQNRDVFRCR